MIDCTSAYNAARVLLDKNKVDIELMTKIGYDCPVFTRLVYTSRDNDTLFLLLKALERANIDVYKIERGLQYAMNKKIVYNNATLKQHKDDYYYSCNNQTNTDVNDYDNNAFVLDLDKENMRMLEHKLKCFHDMSARELYKACVDRDIATQCKDKKKTTLIAALRKYEIEHASKSGIVIEENDSDSNDATSVTSDVNDKYSDMTVKQLYELCKQRDIDVPTRQNKQIYIDLLNSDDNIKAEQSDDVDAETFNEEDWNIT